MKTALLACLLTASAAFAVDPTEAAITEVLNSQVAAWNKGDLEGFMAGYLRSDDLSFYSGRSITAGWKPTLERYKKRYQGEGKEMGQLTFADLRVQSLGDDVAYVRGRWKLTMKDKPKEEKKADEAKGEKTVEKTPEGLFTLILKKTADGWKIVHDHTSD